MGGLTCQALGLTGIAVRVATQSLAVPLSLFPCRHAIGSWPLATLRRLLFGADDFLDDVMRPAFDLFVDPAHVFADDAHQHHLHPRQKDDRDDQRRKARGRVRGR